VGVVVMLQDRRLSPTNNLNEVWHYDDPVDHWAAQREFELRQRRWTVATKGNFGLFAEEAARAIRDIQREYGGLARVLSPPGCR